MIMHTKFYQVRSSICKVNFWLMWAKKAWLWKVFICQTIQYGDHRFDTNYNKLSLINSVEIPSDWRWGITPSWGRETQQWRLTNKNICHLTPTLPVQNFCFKINLGFTMETNTGDIYWLLCFTLQHFQHKSMYMFLNKIDNSHKM